jgi:hypothetical protein
VHRVVDEPRVPAHRHAEARRVEVGLGGDDILPVAEVIADVRHQLDQHVADVGHVLLSPRRQHQGQPLEHEAAEAGVVPRQVVEHRLVPAIVETVGAGVRAVEVGRALELEGEPRAVVAWVDARGRMQIVSAVAHHPHHVRRRVAFGVEVELEDDVSLRVVDLGDPLDADAADPASPLDQPGARVEHRLGRVAEQADPQARADRLRGVDPGVVGVPEVLGRVDAGERRRGAHRGAPVGRSADHLGHAAISAWKVS